MATKKQTPPPKGWKPTKDGGYRNPASGTVIYPNGKGGWSSKAKGGSAQPGLPNDYGDSLGKDGSEASTTTGGKVPKPKSMGGPAYATDPKKPGFDKNDPKQVKDLQRFLKSRGYDVGIDGQWGAQTKSARDNWTLGPGEEKTHRNPGQWNISWKRANAQADDAGKPHPYRNDGTPVPKQQDAGGVASTTTPLFGDMEAVLASIAKLSKVDPNMARDQTNAQYDPLVKEATRQLGISNKDKTQHTADIQRWFEGLIGQNKEGNEADTAALNNVLRDSSGLMKNVLGSITDADARTSVGKTALSNEGLLKGLGLAEGNYNRNMDTALALRGRDESNRQGRTDQAAIENAKAQLLNIIGQKGAALIGNEDKNRQTGLQNQTNLFNLMATGAMLPGQLNQQGLQGMLTEAQITKLMTPDAAKQPTYKTADLADQAAYLIGADDNRRLPKDYKMGQAAQVIGSILRGIPNLQVGSKQYQQLGYQLLNTFSDANGQRLAAPGGWFRGK